MHNVPEMCSSFFRWSERADHVRIVILELCDHPIAGACASQSKEEVVTVRVDYRAWRWRKDLEESISVSKKSFSNRKKIPTSVFSAVTSAILPSARTTRMLKIFSAPYPYLPQVTSNKITNNFLAFSLAVGVK